MLVPERRINVQFLKMGAAENAALKKFIDEGLISKSLAVDQNWNPSKPEEQRQFVRVGAKHLEAEVIYAGKKKANCVIINISQGGICLALPAGVEIKGKDDIEVRLSFIKPAFHTQAKVVELFISSPADASL